MSFITQTDSIGYKQLIGSGSLDFTTTATYVTALSDPHFTNYDSFGGSVAIGSNRIVVGSSGFTSYSGCAYIYDLNGNLLATVSNPSGLSSEYFGYSVAVGSGRIVIGSPYYATPYNSTGRAYIYDLQGNLLKTISNPTPTYNDAFGLNIVIGCNRIVISSNQASSNQGKAWIYDINGSLLATLTGQPSSSDNFGCSISVSSGIIAIGAYGVAITGVVYIYDLNGNLLNTLFNPTGSIDQFGFSVSAGSGKLVVGAPKYPANSNIGRAYIFNLSGKLLSIISSPPTNSQGYNFGGNVVVGSGRIVLGSYSSGFTGIAYIYDLTGKLIQSITNPNTIQNDYFSKVVAISPGNIIMSSPFFSTQIGRVYIYSTPAISDYLNIGS